MNEHSPAVMPDDDDPMTYEPLSCVTVTRDELVHLRDEVARLRLLNERIAADETTALVLIDDLRRSVAELEAENAALRADLADIEAHGGAIAVAVLHGYDRYCAAAAHNSVTPLDFGGWLAMLAGDEKEQGGGNADSSFARARIREALGEGAEVQP